MGGEANAARERAHDDDDHSPGGLVEVVCGVGGVRGRWRGGGGGGGGENIWCGICTPIACSPKGMGRDNRNLFVQIRYHVDIGCDYCNGFFGFRKHVAGYVGDGVRTQDSMRILFGMRAQPLFTFQQTAMIRWE